MSDLRSSQSDFDLQYCAELNTLEEVLSIWRERRWRRNPAGNERQNSRLQRIQRCSKAVLNEDRREIHRVVSSRCRSYLQDSQYIRAYCEPK